ncbi:MAG TPA: molybdopterin-dependent oxidoreductase [Sporichthyaceae bacterium]|nr:molybdopterin-dependent oxidoreductase [Sporichthyaceae bacterium]
MTARRMLGAVCGLLAAAAGLGVAEGLAALLSTPSPVVSVGTWVIDTSPASLTRWAIEHFQANDKRVLVTGVLSTVAVLAAVAGAIGVRARRVALLMTAAIGLVAVVAVATVRGAHDSPLVRVVPALIALLVSTGALVRLLRTLPEPVVAPAVREPEPVAARASVTVREREPTTSALERPAVIIPGRRPGGGGPARREFVRVVGTVGALAVGGGLVRELAGSGHGRRGVVTALPAPFSPAPAVGVADFNIPGLAPYFTTNMDFYRVDTSIQVPLLDARTWQLRIDGMVENPITIGYEDLLRAQLIERDVTLTCVSNEVGGNLVGNARWLGLPLRNLLAAAKPKAGADAIRSHSVDGWTAGTPLSALTDPGRDAMLAIAMNGVPLPAEHGYPVRVVVPGLYGYVSATKWVTRIEVTRFADFQAYWTQRGWAPQGPIKTQSRIDVPHPYADVRAGAETIAGVAWAQHRGISKVEVSVDDQPWQTAALAPWANPDTWRQWRLPWTPGVGTHNLTVRATDATGALQVQANSAPDPDGATGWDTFPTRVVA